MQHHHGITLSTDLASILSAAVASVPCDSRDRFLRDVEDCLRPHAHREITALDVAAAIEFASQRVDG
jgi:hypothetical protein